MSFKINTNLHALSALRHLGQTNERTSENINRLSSGLRINSADDDPSGLVISENMLAQIRGTHQAMKNSQDGINLLKTAEGALSEVQNRLQKMRVLAVHAANKAVVDSNQLQADQNEITASIRAIDNIGKTTSFGPSKKLLDGTAGTNAQIVSPANVKNIYIGGRFGGVTVQDGPVTAQVTVAATKSALNLAATFVASTDIVTTSGTFSVNGYTFSSSGSESIQGIIDKINLASSITGVTAQLTGGGPVSVQLTSNEYGSNFPVNLVDGSNVIHNAAVTSSTGVNATVALSATTLSGTVLTTLTGGTGPKESGLVLRDTDGNSFELTAAGLTGLGGATAVAQVSSGSVLFQTGAAADESNAHALPKIFASELGKSAISGKSLANINLCSAGGATEAIKIIDAALNDVSKFRGELGSFQENFLSSNLRKLAIAKENLEASLSDIKDVDMAEEISDYTRNQIKSRAGQAMLTHAMHAPESVLQFFQ